MPEVITLILPDDAYGKLCELAEVQLRSPEQQARWMLSTALSHSRPLSREERITAARPLFEAIRELHRRNGSPSTRTISRMTRGAVSHNTVHAMLTGSHVPRGALLDAVVTALGGDVRHFRELKGDL